MSVYTLLSRRYLRQRLDRAALIVVSIALGVATLVSSRILNQCIETAAVESATPLSLGDLMVSNRGFGVDLALADVVRAAKVPGVKSVTPLTVAKVALKDHRDKFAIVVGVELASALDPAGAGLEATVTPTGEGPLTLQLQLLGVQKLLADGKLAEARAAWARLDGRPALVTRGVIDGRKPGAKLAVSYGSKAAVLTPVAVADLPPDSAAGALGPNLILMEITQAAALGLGDSPEALAALGGGLASPGVTLALRPVQVDRIDIKLAPGTNKEAARLAIEAALGDRATVRTPEDQGRATMEIVQGVQVAFTLCSLAAMVVGLFLVYNALAVTVAERRADIGILRSLGATRGQIVALFGTLAFILGLVGALVGVPLGTVMARLVLRQFAEELGSWLLNPITDPTWPGWLTVGVAALAGVVTAVGAALIPAVQAANQDPAEVVRRSPRPTGAWRTLHAGTCGLLMLGGLAAVLARHHLPPRVGAFGGMMGVLVGLLLAAPIFVTILVKLIHPLLRRVLAIEARIAADNLLRAPGRTGVVIGALGAGVAVMVQTAGVGRSNEEPVVRWLDEVLQADRFVSSGDLASATSSQSPLDPSLFGELAQLPGVEAAVGFRYQQPEYNGTIVFLIALDASAYAEHTAARSGKKRAALETLAAAGVDSVVVSSNFALKHKVNVGDTITLPSAAGPVELRVAAAAEDYSWSRGTVFIDRAVYARLFQDPMLDLMHVYLSDSAPDSQGSKNLKAFLQKYGLVEQDRRSVRKFLAELIERVYLLAYLQQLVIGAVAALGVVTALLISVLQRKRELGLLLAVGATPGQVVRTVLAESILMGAIGTVLGILIGLPMEYYVLRVVMPEESGFEFDMVVPYRQAAAVAVGAGVTALVAGLLPAWHAVRIRIPEAIAYE